MKFAIVALLSLVAVSGQSDFETSAFGIMSVDSKFFTMEPFKDTFTEEDEQGRIPIADCREGRCLLGDEEWNKVWVNVGLKFVGGELKTLNPGKKANDDDVFDIYLNNTAYPEKASYNGIHILAGDYEVDPEDNKLLEFIKSFKPKLSNEINIYITLPFHSDPAMYDELVKNSFGKFKEVLVYLGNQSVPAGTLEAYLEINSGLKFITTNETYANEDDKEGINFLLAHTTPGTQGSAFSPDANVCKPSQSA